MYVVSHNLLYLKVIFNPWPLPFDSMPANSTHVGFEIPLLKLHIALSFYNDNEIYHTS